MKPIESLLRREADSPEFQSLVSQFGNLLDECVNFGTHVFEWCLEHPKKDHSDLTSFLLFRHLLEMLDGISVLIRQRCADPSFLLLRSGIESLLGLEYILKEDSERRAMSYEVVHVHKKLSMYLKLDPKSQVGKDFRKTLSKDVISKDMKLPELDILKLVNNLKNLLESPEYAPIEQEWQELKKTGRSFEWFSLFGGPLTIQQLADRLGHSSWYEILYRPFSGETHATNSIHHLDKDEDGLPALHGLRYPQNLQQATSLSLSFAFTAYRLMLSSYIPERQSDFNSWYLAEMRSGYLALLQDKIKINFKSTNP